MKPIIIEMDDLQKVKDYHNDDLECYHNLWNDKYYYRDKTTGEGFCYDEDKSVLVTFV